VDGFYIQKFTGGKARESNWLRGTRMTHGLIWYASDGAKARGHQCAYLFCRLA